MPTLSSLSKVALVAILAGSAGLAYANGTRLPSDDAWVVARGHAATASVDSSAAVWYNPAGLSRIPNDDVRLEPSELTVDESFQSAASGQTIADRKKNFFVPTAYAAHRLTDQLVMGLGVLSPYGLSSDWPATSGFGGLATYNEIRYVTGTASLSWQPHPGVAVGASLEYSSAHANLNRLAPVAPGVISSFQFTGRDHALSGNLGAQWDIDAHSSVGVMYQLPTTMKFSGTATLQGVLSEPGNASAWTFPDNLAVGYRYRINAAWDVEVGVDWTFWNHTKVVHLAAGPLSTDLPLGWKNSAYYCAGVEYRINPEWRVAAGYQYSQNSVPDNTFNPSLPDSNRHLLDGGIERTFGRWAVQVYTEVGLKSHRHIAGPAPDGLGGSDAGTFNNSVLLVGTSLGYRF